MKQGVLKWTIMKQFFMECSFPNGYYEPLFMKCSLRNKIYELIVFKMVSYELILLPTVGLCNGCYETNCYEPEFMKHGFVQYAV